MCLLTILPSYISKWDSWWSNIKNLVKYIDAFCIKIFWFCYSFSFPLGRLAPTPLQPLSLTSVLPISIWGHLVWHWHATALCIPNPQWHCPALYQIQCLPRNCLRCQYDYSPPDSSLANFQCPKIHQVHCSHHFWLDDSPCIFFGRHLRHQFVLREVLCRQSWWQIWSFWKSKCRRTIMLEDWSECFDNLFIIWNIYYSCTLLLLCSKFLLSST